MLRTVAGNTPAYFFAAVFFICMTYFSADAETLRILTWKGYAPAGQVEKIEKYIREKYKRSVRLKITYLSDPNDFFDAIRSKEADIISPAHNLIKDERFHFINKGMLLALDLNNIPNYRDIIPALKKADYITENGRIYGVPVAHGPYGLGYNTARLEAPDSWNIFWEPGYAGKYAISYDYYECNIYITALALGYKAGDLKNTDLFVVSAFREKLRQLVKNADRLWTGVDSANDLEGLAIATSWGFSLPELKKRGEIWKIATPREGTMWWVDNFALGYSLKDKPFLRKVAEEWLNFVLSPDFQVDTVVRELASAPVNMAVKDRLTAEERKTYHMENPDCFGDNRILMPTHTKIRDRNQMKYLWEKALR